MSHKQYSSTSKRAKSITRPHNYNNYNNNMELDHFRSDNIFNEFQSLSNNMFRHFDDAFGFPSLSNMIQPFGRMGSGFNFDRLHQQMDEFDDNSNMFQGFSGGGPATVISKSYVMTSKTDQNGNVVSEKYYSDNLAQRGADGKLIGQSKKAYQNTENGLEKITQERYLDDKARKVVKERIRGQNEEKTHNLFKNIDESEAQTFDREWNDYGQKVGLDYPQQTKALNDKGYYDNYANKMGLPQYSNEQQQQQFSRANDYQNNYESNYNQMDNYQRGAQMNYNNRRQQQNMDTNGIYKNKNPTKKMPRAS